MNMKQNGKLSQPLMIVILIGVTILVGIAIWFNSKNTPSDPHAHEEDHGQHAHAEGSDEAHAEQGEHGAIQLTAQQMAEQGLKIAVVSTGMVEKLTTLPGRLVVNTDQQAHISPNFSGHVEQVNVALGQNVKKGQILAVLSVPELIDQQANLRMAEATLELARQEYQREQQLWSQGISAKQDYQRAESAYRQAQISVQSAKARLNALGASGNNNGRFLIRAPISGVISQKDIVVGENVQLADQLFVIEQLKDLWLEFNLPNQFPGQLQPGQTIAFKSNGSEQSYTAVIQSLSPQADVQTGRLVVRAKLNVQADELRPNVLVNVLISEPSAKTALRIQKSALQQIEGEDSIFIVESQEKGQVHLKAQHVVLGQVSSDGEWLEVISGLSEGQKYISQGSFLLKSELEKDEAGHEH
ncbi:efflux RND transporter periplasmic adaptor subunit [Acinetobacter sp. RF15A]|uniref:efflux RND transporter periplasmic adaptor subunit n=2 Tax=Acinetobacter TaxID=469 RepID=UPI001195C79C|nr:MULTISPECIES: efflux RND transporter periplasmic adaptor subunit [unclassified Acinetobacter]TSH77990.1 efflux RND transporter periplasmic adaptor subunit [Acinetobacter sp. RF15A]TSI19979.1 efflux RND transporter periplasmic adaptor subunit [Acinetobacter sp. RF15B]